MHYNEQEWKNETNSNVLILYYFGILLYIKKKLNILIQYG